MRRSMLFEECYYCILKLLEKCQVFIMPQNASDTYSCTSSMNTKRSPKVIWVVLAVVLLLLICLEINYNANVVLVDDRLHLKNILDYAVTPGKSIFLLDTSSSSKDTAKLELLPRAACAIESAARAHPDRDTYMLYTTRGLTKFNDAPSDKYVQILSKYDNIHFAYINVEEYGRGTPLEQLIMNKTIESSQFKVSHTSDMLRTLTLWRYGGIYLDTDVIVLKSFDDLSENFVGVESKDSINCAILGFSHKGVGHEYISSVLNILAKHYDPKAWAANGPALFTE